jgi:hypothetical protein
MYGVYFNVDTDADAVECALTFIVNMHWLLNYLGINRVRIPYTASPGLNVYSVEYPYNVNVRYQNLIGAGVCTKLQATQPPPESRAFKKTQSQSWATNHGMEEISFLLVNVLRTYGVWSIQHTSWSRKKEHTDPDKGPAGCVTPLFLPFPWFGHGSFVPRFPRNSFFFLFFLSRISRVYYPLLDVEGLSLFLISYFLFHLLFYAYYLVTTEYGAHW